jgi:hypothetical protein
LDAQKSFKCAFPSPQFFRGRNELLQQCDNLGSDGTAVLAGAGAQGFVDVFWNVFYV